MKRVVVSICLVLATAIAASAVDYTYTGGYSSNLWKNAANWGGAAYPGQSASDTAIINKSSAANGDFPVWLKANLSYSLAYLRMADGDSTNPVSLTIDDSVTLTASTAFIVGDTAAATYAVKDGIGTIAAPIMTIDALSADATAEHVTFRHADGTINAGLAMIADSNTDSEARLIIDAANFNAGSLILYGGSSTSRECDLDINAAFAVTDDTGTDSTFFGGFSRFDVANSITANLKDVLWNATGQMEVIENSSGQFVTNEFLVQHASDAAITVTKEGAGTIDAGSFKITGQSSNTATFEVKAGSLETR